MSNSTTEILRTQEKPGNAQDAYARLTTIARHFVDYGRRLSHHVEQHEAELYGDTIRDTHEAINKVADWLTQAAASVAFADLNDEAGVLTMFATLPMPRDVATTPVMPGYTQIITDRTKDKQGRPLRIGDVVADTADADAGGGTVVALMGQFIGVLDAEHHCDVMNAEDALIVGHTPLIDAIAPPPTTDKGLCFYPTERSVDIDGKPIKPGDLVERLDGYAFGPAVAVFDDIMILSQSMEEGDGEPGSFAYLNCEDCRIIPPVTSVADAIAEARERHQRRTAAKQAATAGGTK